MTYKEKVQEKHERFAKASDTYIKALNKVAEEVDGFFDPQVLKNLEKCKKEWEDSALDYHSLTSFIKKQGIDLDSNIGNPNE